MVQTAWFQRNSVFIAVLLAIQPARLMIDAEEYLAFSGTTVEGLKQRSGRLEVKALTRAPKEITGPGFSGRLDG